MKRTPKKETSKTIKKECDHLWSLCVRTRDKTCRNCNSDERLTAHHVSESVRLATRHDIENGICLCWPCHSNQKWGPQSFAAMVIRIIGWPEFNRLIEKGHTIETEKKGIGFWREERDRLQRELKAIKADYGFTDLPFLILLFLVRGWQ